MKMTDPNLETLFSKRIAWKIIDDRLHHVLPSKKKFILKIINLVAILHDFASIILSTLLAPDHTFQLSPKITFEEERES